MQHISRIRRKGKIGEKLIRIAGYIGVVLLAFAILASVSWEYITWNRENKKEAIS